MESMSETGTPNLPPPTFEFLVFSLKTQAEMNMGLIQLPGASEQPNVDLAMARHFIDLLSVLQDKTRNNLELGEQRLIENSLTELRFRFVQATQEAKQA